MKGGWAKRGKCDVGIDGDCGKKKGRKREEEEQREMHFGARYFLESTAARRDPGVR